MFSFIKQVFIVLLSFSSSLTRVAKVSDQTKCLSLNDEPCMVKPIFTGLNTVERKYYSFMISLDKCNGSCNVLTPKICVSKETKDLNVKVYNMITNKNEAKTMVKHTSLIANAKLIVQHVIQIKKGIMRHANVNVKIIVSAKKMIVGILTHVFVRIASIQKVSLILQ